MVNVFTARLLRVPVGPPALLETVGIQFPAQETMVENQHQSHAENRFVYPFGWPPRWLGASRHSSSPNPSPQAACSVTATKDAEVESRATAPWLSLLIALSPCLRDVAIRQAGHNLPRHKPPGRSTVSRPCSRLLGQRFPFPQPTFGRASASG